MLGFDMSWRTSRWISGSCRRRQRETSEPGPPPALHRPSPQSLGRVGAPGVPGAGQARATQPYQCTTAVGEAPLTTAILELAKEFGRYGYRRVTGLLRAEGWSVNHKRVERIWRREGLKVPQRQPKRGRLWLNDGSCIRLRPLRPNHVWAYDFVFVRTQDGRLVKILTVIGEFTRECLALRAERHLRSDDVLECLTELFTWRGVPEHLRRITVVNSQRRRSGAGWGGLERRRCTSSRGVLGRTATTRASTGSSGTNSSMGSCSPPCGKCRCCWSSGVESTTRSGPQRTGLPAAGT